MNNIIINWKRDLGSPKKPGMYPVSGLGEVDVTQGDIDDAAQVGEDSDVEVSESTTFQSKIKTYVVGNFIPKRKGGSKQ